MNKSSHYHKNSVIYKFASNALTSDQPGFKNISPTPAWKVAKKICSEQKDFRADIAP